MTTQVNTDDLIEVEIDRSTAIELDILVSKTRQKNLQREEETRRVNAVLDSVEERLAN